MIIGFRRFPEFPGNSNSRNSRNSSFTWFFNPFPTGVKMISNRITPKDSTRAAGAAVDLSNEKFKLKLKHSDEESRESWESESSKLSGKINKF